MTAMQPNSENSDEKMTTVMAEDLDVKGTITFKTSLMIKGSLEGEIISEGMLVIGETAKINAAITTQSLVSNGTIEGDVTAGEQVVLKSTAVHTGKITTPNIVVESGSLFNGSCVMERKKPEPPREAVIEEQAAESASSSQDSPEVKPEAEVPEPTEQAAETGAEDDSAASTEARSGQFGFSWPGSSDEKKEY